MYRMAMLAMLLSDSEPQLDISKCVMMALVHDLAEAEVGDITPHDGISREEKHRREATAIDRFTTELLPDNSIPSKRLRDLWNEYEVQETKEARFVKDLDRFELALQAVEYEKGTTSLPSSYNEQGILNADQSHYY
ncbi:HD domain-containing protein [Phakopsora pachyrhizi]|nr:HD domain-containing protein [Phakopsora pachyrhizi]